MVFGDGIELGDRNSILEPGIILLCTVNLSPNKFLYPFNRLQGFLVIVTSCLTWTLGAKLGSFAGAVHAFDCQTVSSTSLFLLLILVK